MGILENMTPPVHKHRKLFQEHKIGLFQLQFLLTKYNAQMTYTALSAYLRGLLPLKPAVEAVFDELAEALHESPGRNTPNSSTSLAKLTRISPSTSHAKPLSTLQNQTPTPLRKRRKTA
jgi:hypothetical protein